MVDIKSLHNFERKILHLIQDSIFVSSLSEKTDLQDIEIMRAIQWLENKKLLTTEQKITSTYELTEKGRDVKEKGLPEKRFLLAIKERKKRKQDLNPELKKKGIPELSSQEISVSIGILKKKGYIEMVTEKETCFEITQKGKKADFKKLETILKHPSEDEEALQRGLIHKVIKKDRLIKTTKELKKLQAKLKDHSIETIDRLTPEIIKNSSWKKKELRAYDVEINVPKVYGGRRHPLSALMNIIRDIFIEMGFEEMSGPLVETAFWCFDSMWIPQDHPARDVQDTFFLPYKGKLPDKKTIANVKKAHESGGDTGSKGYGYSWDPELSRQLLLRTHTTATTYRYFGQKGIKDKQRAKYFYIGRIFRNEAIDWTHLAEFHQVEGFVMDDGLSLKHLMGFIKEFYSKMGIHKIKFKLTYNPYTEPSLEALYYDDTRERWIELINSGMFRPESLAPYGIKKPVIAWGLGVERLAMILYQADKLKDLIGHNCDLNWLRSYKALIREG